jgi:hypothetical protein
MTADNHGDLSIVNQGKVPTYVGGLVCALGGIYLGKAYGAGYWRFGPLTLAWDTIFRGTVFVLIGFMLIRISK